MIGVTFLIAVVSIVGGMSRYMKDDFVGKLIAVNSFELRRAPDIQTRRRDRGRVARVAPPPAHPGRRDVAPVAAALAAGRAVGRRERRQPERRVASTRRRGSTQCSTVSERLVRDQEDGRVARAACSRRRSTRSARRSSSSARTSPTTSSRTSIRSAASSRIQGIPYTVIGVAEKQGSVFGMSLDKFIIAPDKSPLNRWVNPHGVIDAMIIQAPSRRRDAARRWRRRAR